MIRITIFSVLGIGAAAFIYIGIPWIYARWLRLLLKLKATKLRFFALTFDDGPGSKLTPTILRILAEHDAKVAFFPLGRNIAGREQLVRQMASQGHEICSHGYDHLHYWKVSPVRAIKDIKRGWQAIDYALGVNHGKYPFRPPNGKLNIVCLLYLLIRRVPIIYWTLDLGDTWDTEPHDYNRMALLAKKAGGAVAMAHDFDRTNDRVDRLVLESVRLALTMAKETGLEMATVMQLLRRCK